MKGFLALALGLLAAMLCQAQGAAVSQPAEDEAYTQELIRLMTGLQKNPWAGWETGTEVVIRYLIDRDANGKPLGYEQPDLLHQVAETDKRVAVTQVVKGRPIRQEFPVKDHSGIETASPSFGDRRPTDIQIDGITLSSVMSELTVNWFPGGPSVTRQWALTAQPSIVLRKEVQGGPGWMVSSARVIKNINGKKFSCIEIKRWMRFNGPNEALTTQYLSPDIPGHLVEEIKEFFKLKNGQRLPVPFQVVHQKVVELRLTKLDEH